MHDHDPGAAAIMAAVSVLVFSVAMFLPWFRPAVHGDTTGLLEGVPLASANGWEVSAPWSWLPLLLGVVLAVLLAAPRLAPDGGRPDLPWWAPLALGVTAVALVVAGLVLGQPAPGNAAALVFDATIEMEPSYGILVALVAAGGMAGAGALDARAHLVAAADDRTSSPSH